MNVLALSFKFEPKRENSKKSKSLDILKFKKCRKHVTKKLLLRKRHVRFTLHFALAAEGYIWGKGIILL